MTLPLIFGNRIYPNMVYKFYPAVLGPVALGFLPTLLGRFGFARLRQVGAMRPLMSLNVFEVAFCISNRI